MSDIEESAARAFSPSRNNDPPVAPSRRFIITNTVEMDEPADEVIFVVRLRGLRVA
jgi:hypothetical protein